MRVVNKSGKNQQKFKLAQVSTPITINNSKTLSKLKTKYEKVKVAGMSKFISEIVPQDCKAFQTAKRRKKFHGSKVCCQGDFSFENLKSKYKRP